jgi:hypothetical protein
MAVNELLSICAYCIFLTGAARSFRTNGDRSSVWIMACGIGLDAVLALLPMAGITALRGAQPAMNAGIIAGIILGATTWTVFAAALILRAVKKTGAYHALIAAAQVTWFIAYVSFLLGMYKFA